MALQAGFDRARAAGMRETYEIRTGGSVFEATVDDGQLMVREGTGPERPSLVIAGDLRTLLDAALGRLGPAAGRRRAQLSVEGDPAALGRFRDLFLGRFARLRRQPPSPAHAAQPVRSACRNAGSATADRDHARRHSSDDSEPRRPRSHSPWSSRPSRYTAPLLSGSGPLPGK
jgi:hypothetical protein